MLWSTRTSGLRAHGTTRFTRRPTPCWRSGCDRPPLVLNLGFCMSYASDHASVGSGQALDMGGSCRICLLAPQAPGFHVLAEGPTHQTVLREVIAQCPHLTGNRIHDAQIAALMLEHGSGKSEPTTCIFTASVPDRGESAAVSMTYPPGRAVEIAAAALRPAAGRTTATRRR